MKDRHSGLKYPDWESLISSNAWRNYLEDPEKLFNEWVERGKAEEAATLNFSINYGITYETYNRKYNIEWIENQREKLSAIRLGLCTPASSLRIGVRSTDKYLNPDDMTVGITDFKHPFGFSKVNIGELVAAMNLPQDKILQVANIPPLGTDGGLQMIADYSGKMVTPIVDKIIQPKIFPRYSYGLK